MLHLLQWLGILSVTFTCTFAQLTDDSLGPEEATLASKKDRQPNIVIYMTDDLGRSDVSFTEGSIQTPTPNIDKFAWDGVILNRHYSTAVCTPTRASFLTGKYIFQLGIPHAAQGEGAPWGVPLQFKFMPQYFKDLGYQTFHVGKWHVGNHMRAFQAINRGFDSSYGYTLGLINNFNYTIGWLVPVPYSGRDLLDNGRPVPWNVTNNWYLPELFTSKAIQMIRTADPSKPFLMYYCSPLPRASVDSFGPAIHTMPEYQMRPAVLKFTDQFPNRKRLLAMIQAMDQNFKDITDALDNKGILNNTIIAFFSDNGAPNPPIAPYARGVNHGSNWPLRNGKNSYFEGGIRTPAFIWSKSLKKRGRFTDQLFSVTDWLPTLYEAAGGNLSDLAPHNVSGFSHWQHFQDGNNNRPRTELPAIIDVRNNPTSQFAMIFQDAFGTLFKLCGGSIFGDTFFGWWPTEAANTTISPDGNGRDDRTWTPLSVQCNFPEGQEVTPCVGFREPCLFDITNDPCETNNIIQSFPQLASQLRARLDAYNATSAPSVFRPFDSRALPENWGGYWVPWLDPQPIETNPITFSNFNPSESM